MTLHYITLHYITLHYITLHYITLHYTSPPRPRASHLYLGAFVSLCVLPVEEGTAATLGHHLGAEEVGQFTEAVGAVDDGVAAGLGVAQHEVTVCGRDRKFVLLVMSTAAVEERRRTLYN